MMTDDEILARIRKVVTNHMGGDEAKLTLETSFSSDLDADSLDIIELILRFEEAFKIDMADEASMKIETLNDMLAYIKTKLAEKEKAA
jgi:acyl carrier protein